MHFLFHIVKAVFVIGFIVFKRRSFKTRLTVGKDTENDVGVSSNDKRNRPGGSITGLSFTQIL